LKFKRWLKEAPMIQRVRHSHIFSKEKLGHYPEPAWCSEQLFAVEKFGPKGCLILDPACGWGTILQSAQRAGFQAAGTDIAPRWQDGPIRLRAASLKQHDFLNSSLPLKWRPMSIVCNPPFDHVDDFCIRALSIAKYKVAMLCLLRRLPAAHWLQSLPLQTIYFLTPRPSMPPGEWIAAGNKPGGGTQDFVWLVFNKQQPPFNAWPTFKWLHRDGAA
jgi:hypothetical protein